MINGLSIQPHLPNWCWDRVTERSLPGGTSSVTGDWFRDEASCFDYLESLLRLEASGARGVVLSMLRIAAVGAVAVSSLPVSVHREGGGDF